MIMYGHGKHTMCRAIRGAVCMSLVVLAMVLFSCRPDTICRQDLSVSMGVSVAWLQVDTAGKATVQTKWDSISVWGVGNDSVLYANAKEVSELRLPLRADTMETAYVLLWHGQQDTLLITHDNTRRFISQACGCMVYHTLEKVVHRGGVVDSVEVLNSLIESAREDNIRLSVHSADKETIVTGIE